MSTETRGRPRLREDHEILQAALEAFARHGYDAMSLRSLNTELGLAHGTINQRFKSKEQLYFAAVDHGFETFIAEIERVQAQRPKPVTRSTNSSRSCARSSSPRRPDPSWAA